MNSRSQPFEFTSDDVKDLLTQLWVREATG